MNKRALIIALLSSLLGVVLLQLYMHRFEAEASGGAVVEVLMARKEVPAGTLLTNDHLASYGIPERFISHRNVRASDLSSVIGTRVSTLVKAGEPVLWTDIAELRQNRSLADLVQTGMVATEIPGSTFDGLLGPGDRVDVLFSIESSDLDLRGVGGRPVKATTILQSVLVLSVRGKMSRDSAMPGTGSSVVILLTPEQAELLVVSARIGKVSLVLRNADDLEHRNLPAVSVKDLADPARRAEINATRSLTASTGEFEHVQ